MSMPALARARRADASVHSSAVSSPGRSTIVAAPIAAPVHPPVAPRRSAPTGAGPAERVVRTNGAAAAKRKRHHLGFVLFAGVVVGLLVLGLVTLNAFVAQSSFRIDHLRARVDEQSQRYQALERQAAHLSAPGRVAAWASRHAMRTPEDISVLHVSGLHAAGPHAAGPQASGPRVTGAGGATAGEPDALAPDRLSLKPIIEGGG
jgi:cell division protein FtsL